MLSPLLPAPKQSRPQTVSIDLDRGGREDGLLTGRDKHLASGQSAWRRKGKFPSHGTNGYHLTVSHTGPPFLITLDQKEVCSIQIEN